MTMTLYTLGSNEDQIKIWSRSRLWWRSDQDKCLICTHFAFIWSRSTWWSITCRSIYYCYRPTITILTSKSRFWFCGWAVQYCLVQSILLHRVKSPIIGLSFCWPIPASRLWPKKWKISLLNGYSSWYKHAINKFLIDNSASCSSQDIQVFEN